jgi:transposase
MAIDIDLSAIPKPEAVTTLAQAREVIALQAVVIEQFLTVIKELEGRTETLEAQLAKNSRNSSQPPSSDGYKKPKPKSQRSKSGRNSGGQKGHKGQTLEQVAHPDEVVSHEVHQCDHCGHSLRHQLAYDYECRQVFELPRVKIRVIEHRGEIKECPHCERRVKAPFPDSVGQPVQYGQRFKATVTYFSQYQLLPYQRLQEVLGDLFHVEMSQGTIRNILRQSHQSLEPFEDRVKARLVEAKCVHFDETGLRLSKKLHWLHVASTQSLTHYLIHPKRGLEATQAMGILPQFRGRAIHDHWRAYYHYDCDHGLCNAHHLRELTHAEEQYQQHWAGRLKACLLDAKSEVDAAQERGASELSARRLNYHQRRYSRILRQGRAGLPVIAPSTNAKGRKRKKQHPAKNLHDRLAKHKREALAFLYDFSVPFDNNQAERDIRMAKVKQKISGCFRSEDGAAAFARIRSYISTAKKQAQNVLDILTDAFEGRPFFPASS